MFHSACTSSDQVKATGTAIIRDEFNVTQLCRTNVTWQFHTNAHVSLRTLDGGGTVVTLAQGGKTVTVNAVVAPAGAAWVSEQVWCSPPHCHLNARVRV
eukprot:m.81109 g.81109  ORF g.81109 m.81109 type:complete len:99 (+) comp16318_c0_seq11:2790-3086(+)